MLNKIKLIMGLNDSDQDSIINAFIEGFSSQISVYCNTSELPEQLQFIVIEATVSRMNRLGSEGLKSESIDVIGFNYIEDLLEPYKLYLDNYKKTAAKVKFL